MNQDDEAEVIMDTLAGESSLKKILELLEDLSRRMVVIETEIYNQRRYTDTYGTTTAGWPYSSPSITWTSNTTQTYTTPDGTSYNYYLESDEKQA